MKIFLQFLRTDFLILLRGRVGMFWTLAFPALMLVLQMTLFGSAPSLGPIELVVITPQRSVAGQAYADYLADALDRQVSLKAKVHITHQMPDRPVDVTLTVPDELDRHVNNGNTTRVTWGGTLTDRITLNAVKGIVSGITDAYNVEASGRPRAISIAYPSAAAASGANYTLYLVTGLAGMIILSTSLMGFAPVLVGAREGGMFKMYQLFPMWPGMMLLVWLVSRLLLTLCSSLMMFVLAWFLYRLKIDGSWLQAAAALMLVALGTGAFLAMGMLVACWSNSVASATMVANLLYFPLLFTGNVMIPVNNLPATVKAALEMLPLNALVGAVRGLLSGQPDYFKLGYTVLLLSAITLLSLASAFRHSKWHART